MKVLRNSSVVKMLALLFCTSIVAIAAQAQSAVQGTFQLAEEVRWEGHVLAAGEYTLTIDSAQNPVIAVVRSADSKKALMLMTSTLSDAQQGGSALQLTRADGGTARVQSLNLPQLGFALVYAGASTEQATAEVQAVPVVVAGN